MQMKITYIETRIPAEIISFNVMLSDNESNGTNFMGQIKHTTYKGNAVILKMAPTHRNFRTILCIERAYRCEIFMYETVFPLFERMQIRVPNPFDAYPKYYASSNANLAEALILEDKTSMTTLNRRQTLTRDQALVLATEIGRFHALSFVLRKTKPGLLAKIAKNVHNEALDADYSLKCLQVMIGLRFETIMEALGEHREEREKFRAFAKTYERFLRLDDGGEHGVLVHGDLWVCNLMWGDATDDVCIIDWQTVRLTSPAVDVAAILFLCCDGEVRREYGVEIVETYYAGCAEHLRQLDVDVDEVFPRAVLERHLNKYGGYAVCVALRTIGMLSVAVEDFPNVPLAKNYIELGEMWGQAKIETEVFNGRSVDVVLDYIASGYDI